MISKQIDNFFELPNLIYHECKKVELFSMKDHPDASATTKWPGYRSLELGASQPLLKYFCMKYLDLNNIKAKIDLTPMYIHSRPIYVSKTNLNSGTTLYNDKDEIINDFKFVQNRLVFFDSKYRHMAYGHHGENINDSRLTINGFIK
jgi:hypothetical protein